MRIRFNNIFNKLNKPNRQRSENEIFKSLAKNLDKLNGLLEDRYKVAIRVEKDLGKGVKLMKMRATKEELNSMPEVDIIA